jgi:hypothetical protein
VPLPLLAALGFACFWSRLLLHLRFGEIFDQPVDSLILPTSLQQLDLGNYSDQPVDKLALPSGLQKVHFGPDFNQHMGQLTRRCRT